jgi:predicted permease
MNPMVEYVVEPGYLKAMGLRLKAGRFIADQDTPTSPRVVVIDDNFARKYYPGENPIGKVIHTESDTGKIPAQLDYRIVGVVGHVNQWGLDPNATIKSPLREDVFYAVSQLPEDQAQNTAQFIRVFVHTSADPATQIGVIRQVLTSYNPNLVMATPETMESIVADSLKSMRFSMALLGAFAALALLLAMIGIYGVMSYAVGQRTHEIGIRMALGAKQSDLLAMVIKQGSKMALIGIVIGVIGAALLTQLMASMLSGVSATDPVTFTSVALLLMLMAFFACLIPARRATRVQPLEVLRYQ